MVDKYLPCVIDLFQKVIIWLVDSKWENTFVDFGKIWHIKLKFLLYCKIHTHTVLMLRFFVMYYPLLFLLKTTDYRILDRGKFLDYPLIPGNSNGWIQYLSFLMRFRKVFEVLLYIIRLTSFVHKKMFIVIKSLVDDTKLTLGIFRTQPLN